MRIISGKYKGLMIAAPEGIRPTEDKVRKALFDILGDIEGLSFLELFAGSGSVGLEALSRGAKGLTLVEQDRDCLAAIEKNSKTLAKDCRIYPQSVEEVIRALHGAGQKFDLIFLDPPYYQAIAKKTLQMLAAYDILAPNGFIIIQHFKKDSLPEAAEDLSLFRQSNYGETRLSFYSRSNEQNV